MIWKKIYNWFDDLKWDIKNSIFMYRLALLKSFFKNAWNYRKELAEVYHVDYYLEFFILLNRFNEEFSKGCIINWMPYKSERQRKKDLIRFYTIKELTKRLYENKYPIKNYNFEKEDDFYKETQDFKMLFEYIRKYSGKWWR